eukprot:CAMPEP_0115548326 /NCGR_PEP_ID=MMETSP0271-20121206/94107_1 /TAXON_ID=71861 /ORGANISM="Scrippsiella trochoidea, Strain CCMP3099" /LENGTH=282 /DNA_ID=CAMNT_0002981791 /DNA_START=71 /DNA_END=916 /DNA_ORIENTATION=-
MGAQCSCVSDPSVGTEVVEGPTVREARNTEEELVVGSRAITTEGLVELAPVVEDEEEQTEEVDEEPEPEPPKPHSASSSPRSRRGRKPTWCAPEAVLGEWRTQVGFYEIFLNEHQELCFTESQLHGVLRLEGEWYMAEIRDSSTEEDSVFGYLRLQRREEVIRSQFKKSAEDSWEGTKHRDAKRLPYLRIGVAAAAQALAEEAERPWDQSTCCICFEALDAGEDFAELKCHHMFHKSCIRSWFHAAAPRRSREVESMSCEREIHAARSGPVPAMLSDCSVGS